MMFGTAVNKLWLLVMLSIALTPTRSFSDVGHDEAIKSLQNFLFNATERRSFASQNPKAQDANNYLESFPDWAQQEILSIIMEIMKQEGENAARYGNIAALSGAQAAGQQLSPALRERVSALAKKLASDPHFSSQEKLKNMQQTMPFK
ncbi:MAG: hypothetical protein WCI18_11710 [Pseudomonadota bacterium]